MMPRLMLRLMHAAIVCVLCLSAGAPIRAEDAFGFDTSLNVYTEQPYSKLPLKSVDSVTRIDGAVAVSHIVYTFVDGLSQTEEVGLNFHLPSGAVLDGFGYYYGSRYIRGKIYSNDQAWKIYTAVTSRGRDPGIMDRPDDQDYHTQIYPVLPKQNLRVIVDLVQQLPMISGDAVYTLPLQQSSEVADPARIHARVELARVSPGDIAVELPQYVIRRTMDSLSSGTTVVLNGDWLPKSDWTIRIAQKPGAARPFFHPAVFSRLPRGGCGSGAFAATVLSPCALSQPRIILHGGAGVRLTLPNAYDDLQPGQPLAFTGRYTRPGPALLTIRSARHAPITMRLMLGSMRVRDDENPAAKLWADKRIAALQNSPRNRKQEVVGLSRRYTVVSDFTALLAIPAEELERYRQLAAQQAVRTNTDTIGGGGGDPIISVDAPEDAKQVVAVFPDGTVKNLDYDTARRAWTGRFDYPLGTPAGEYDVTIIVVHADGKRTRLILTYSNLLDAPQVTGKQASQAADALGGARTVRVRIDGERIARATVVAPWGEREAMARDANAGGGDASGAGGSASWFGAVSAPGGWPAGRTALTVVCYDGAHNRSEVTVNVDLTH